MDYLLKSKLFCLLSETPEKEITTDEMKNAYENFVKEVITLNQSEADHPLIFRKLNLTRIEFVALRLHPQYGQGEKCPKKSILSKSYSVS